MKAFNLSLLIMLFFLLNNLFVSFTEFSDMSGRYSDITKEDGTEVNTSFNDDISDSYQTSSEQLEKLKNDDGILSIFSTVLYTLKLTIVIIAKTLYNMLIFIPVLLSWGVPLAIASFIQVLLWLVMILSIIELLGHRT